MIGNLTDERAIKIYTELQRLISVGAYSELDEFGEYPEDDDVLRNVDALDHAAAMNGLKFVYAVPGYKLVAMDEDDIRMFQEAEAKLL